MNLPNILTFSRIPLLFLIVFLCQIPQERFASTLAFVFFVVAGLTDFFDGYVARRYGQVSDTGKFMDALTDKILVLGLYASFFVVGIFPLDFRLMLLYLLILTREFLITGLRLVAITRGVVLAAEQAGKLKMAVQSVSLGALLFGNMMTFDFGGLLPAEWVRFVTHYLGIGGTAAAAALTVFSGSLYLAKYGSLLLTPLDPR